jgi:hypothetical protein
MLVDHSGYKVASTYNDHDSESGFSWSDSGICWALSLFDMNAMHINLSSVWTQIHRDPCDATADRLVHAWFSGPDDPSCLFNRL